MPDGAQSPRAPHSRTKQWRITRPANLVAERAVIAQTERRPSGYAPTRTRDKPADTLGVHQDDQAQRALDMNSVPAIADEPDHRCEQRVDPSVRIDSTATPESLARCVGSASLLLAQSMVEVQSAPTAALTTITPLDKKPPLSGLPVEWS